MDQYSDLVTVSKPVIYISIGEMINTHTVSPGHVPLAAAEKPASAALLGCGMISLRMCLQLLLDHQDAIAPEHNDPIHELLEDLGEVPTVESLIGEWTAPVALHTEEEPDVELQVFGPRGVLLNPFKGVVGAFYDVPLGGAVAPRSMCLRGLGEAADEM